MLRVSTSPPPRKKSKFVISLIAFIFVSSGALGALYYNYYNNVAEEVEGPEYRWEVSSLRLEFEVTSMQLSEGDEGAGILWELFFDTDNTDEHRDGDRCWNNLQFQNYMTGTWWPPSFDSGSGPCVMLLNDISELNSNVNFCAYHNFTDAGNPDGQMYDMANWGLSCGVENYPDFRSVIPELDYEFNICEPDELNPQGNWGEMFYSGEGDILFEGGWDDSNNPSEQYFAKATVTFEVNVAFDCLEN